MSNEEPKPGWRYRQPTPGPADTCGWYVNPQRRQVCGENATAFVSVKTPALAVGARIGLCGRHKAVFDKMQVEQRHLSE